MSAYAVFPEKGHHCAIVRQQSNRRVTCSWHSGSVSCEHTRIWAKQLKYSLRALRQMHDQYYREYYGSERDKFQFIPSCHSHAFIPLPKRWSMYAPGIYDYERSYPWYHEMNFYDRDARFNERDASGNLITVILEPGPKCVTCGTELDESCSARTNDAEVLTADRTFTNVKVRIVTCPNESCAKRINYYDGCSDHIFNPDSKRLYCHKLLNAFTHHIWAFGRPSDRSFHDSIHFAYEEAQSNTKFVSLPTFMPIWRSFIGKQLWQFSNICLLCDRALQNNPNNKPCGESDAMVADACVCGCKANQNTRIHNPKEIFDESYVLENVCDESNRFIKAARKRKLLERWFKKNLLDIRQDHVCVFCLLFFFLLYLFFFFVLFFRANLL